VIWHGVTGRVLARQKRGLPPKRISPFLEWAAPAETLGSLSLAGVKVDQKSIDLKPGQDGKLFFNLLVENPGWVDGEVKLSPDRLNADDVFYFPLKVKEKVKVLVVDGDPKTSLKASESYYLANALHPGSFEASPFQTRVITVGEMDRVDLRFYDVLFLLNVARPDFSRLAFFMEMGRPAFIFLGDQIVPEAYNRFSLASWQIGEVIDLSRSAEKTDSIEAGIGENFKFLKQLEPSLSGALFQRSG
jgi:hypothetical protein